MEITNEDAYLERMIGRLASRSGPPDALYNWSRDQNIEELFVVPVVPWSSLNESIRVIWSREYSHGILVTVRRSEENDDFELVWMTVTAQGAHNTHTECDLPTTPSTTINDVLRILTPGATITVRLGDEELFFQPSAASEPIADEVAIKSLRELVSV